MREHRIDEKNYIQWSQIVKTYLKGRGKLCHLEGTGPSQKDPKFQAWNEEDSMIMSQLWSSMQAEISKNCMFLFSAQEIWETIHQLCSKAQNVVVIFELKTKISTTKQGTLSVIEYYNVMRGLWLRPLSKHTDEMPNRC